MMEELEDLAHPYFLWMLIQSAGLRVHPVRWTIMVDAYSGAQVDTPVSTQRSVQEYRPPPYEV